MSDADAQTTSAQLSHDAAERLEAQRRDSLAREIAGARALQDISTRLISEVTPETLFAQLLEAAMELLGSDAASLQLLAPDGKTLVLIGWKNFHPVSADFWRLIPLGGGCACGRALAEQQRVLIADVENCEFVTEGGNLNEYRRSNIRAVQSTPLYSRRGHALGMLSTHWRKPHVPSESEFTLFDVLTRQAADLIERTQAEEAARENEDRQAFLLKLSDMLRTRAQADTMASAAVRMVAEKLKLDRFHLVWVNLPADRAVVTHEYRRPDLASLIGAHHPSSFPETMRHASERTIIFDDVQNEASISEKDRHSLARADIGAIIGASLRDGDGDVVWGAVAVSAQPRHWSASEVALVEQCAERIWGALERARAEEALRASETKYRSLFESMDEAFYLLGIVRDEEDRAVDIVYLDENAAGARLARGSVVGTRLSELNPRVIPEWVPLFDRVDRSGQSERFEKISSLTGNWHHYHVFPAGSGKHHVGILSYDISGRKAAEEKVRESEEKFRAIANSAPVIIWMSNVENRCVFVNQPWLTFTGQTLEETLAEGGWARNIHPEDVLLCSSTFFDAQSRLEKCQMEFRLRRADGEYRWFVSSCAPRFNEDGSFAGYVGSSVDVTERKEAEVALATINRRVADAQEDERARIARELHDEVVQRLVGLGWRIGGASEADKLRADIMRLAQDVQTLSHSLHPHWKGSLDIALSTRTLCHEMAQQTGIAITCEAGDVSDTSRENAACLQRVLREALQNACKHSRAAKVEVTLRSNADEIEMIVKDFGVGFDPAASRYQGLGLTSMKERLDDVGGRLLISSREDGTTIQAFVPIVADPQG